jgi:hypothetical protein
LEQQTVVGTLHVDDASALRAERRYCLPGGHAEVLVDQTARSYLAPLAQLMVGTVRPLDAVVEAFRSGRGVPFEDYGSDMREGEGGLNRVAYLEQLGKEWLPSIPDVQARLLADPPARVADIGCGLGWASIGLARAYPKLHVDGFDIDAPSIDGARATRAQWTWPTGSPSLSAMPPRRRPARHTTWCSPSSASTIWLTRSECCGQCDVWPANTVR